MTREELLRRYPRASEDFLAANCDLLDCKSSSEALALLAGKSSTMIRQRRQKGSKTQTAFGEELKRMFPHESEWTILEEQITLELANGVRLTPDFAVIHSCGPGSFIRFYEVKGKYAYEDAKIKLKFAARVHAWAYWFLARRDSIRDPFIVDRVLP